MGKEIERKFKVTGDGWRDAVRKTERIRQGYLSVGEASSVRIRIVDGETAILGIKASTTDARAREEFEYPIPVKDARRLIRLAGDRVLIKRRHTLKVHGKVWVIDTYEGRQAGLVLAEIELGRRNEHFERPDWLGEDVTGNPAFSNARLAGTPG